MEMGRCALSKFECFYLSSLSIIAGTKFESRLLDSAKPIATIVALPLDVRRTHF